MKVWKRNLLIVYVVCAIIAAVYYYLYVMGSSSPIFVKFLLALVGLAPVAGVAIGGYALVYALVHERATLHAGPEGTINIERSALESTARRAVSSLEGVKLQRVVARVVERKGDALIDLTVTAVPYGAESLMTTASRIQMAVKGAVEAFTDHEVRYVAVNFVEPHTKVEVKAAQAAVDARAASGYAAPRYASPAASETAQAATRGTESSFRAQTAKPSLWERAKARVGAERAKRDEDVVDTVAVVVDGLDSPGEAASNASRTESKAVSELHHDDADVCACDDDATCSQDKTAERETGEVKKDEGSC